MAGEGRNELKIIDELIVYLDGMGLLSDTEKLRLWQHCYFPDVSWPGVNRSEQEAATRHLDARATCAPPEPEAVLFVLVVNDVVTGGLCEHGISSTEPDDPSVLGLDLHIDGTLVDQPGTQEIWSGPCQAGQY